MSALRLRALDFLRDIGLRSILLGLSLFTAGLIITGSAAVYLAAKLAPIEFGAHRWTFHFAQQSGLAAAVDYDGVWLVLIGGLSFSLLLSWLAISLLRTRRTARRTADQLAAELKASEAHFHHMADAAPMLFWQSGTDALCNYFNQTWLDFTGRSLAQEMGNGWAEGVHPDDFNRCLDIYQTAFKARQKFKMEYRLRRADGEFRWILDHGVPRYSAEGVFLGFIGSCVDVTDRRQTADALTQTLWRMERILEGTHIGTWEWNIQTGEVVFNETWAEFIGYTLAELAPVSIQTWKKLTHPEDLKKSNELLALHFAGDLPFYDVECRMKHKDGRWIWIHDRGQLMTFTAAGKPLMMFGTHTDITQQKQAQELIRLSEEKYRTVANFTYDWEAWRSPEGIYLYVSPSCERVCGYPAAQFLADPNLIEDITHPDDRAHLVEHLHTASHGAMDQNLEIDFRIITPSGETRWIGHSCTAVYSDEGDWMGRRESNRDITDRKREEELLGDSENRYRRLFEAAKDGILILEAETGMIQDVNPFLIDLLGYSREQFIQKNIWEIGFFKDIAANQEKFLELQREEYVRYENLPLETADGRKIFVEFVSNVYLADNRKVIQCNIRDITARRAAEEKIRLLNSELEQLADTDGLTGIYNHRALLKLAEHEFDVAMRYHPPLAMIFFDIDNFKQINDIFGHSMGDQALIKTVQAVSANLRSADIIGRYGGDEFVLLLPQTSAQEALPLAERIHASVAEMRLETEKGLLTLTISIGIAQSIHEPGQHDRVESLLLRADQALYAAKQAGKNCTMSYSAARD